FSKSLTFFAVVFNGVQYKIVAGTRQRKNLALMTKITDALSLHVIDLTDEINLFVVRDWVLLSALA
ncbi:hypothetical protein, partial [Microseira wollei]|uniref:hypothetical protein n=1 Tax=Microseira wollei TaxID=467598 RepID=UPI001CFC878D